MNSKDYFRSLTLHDLGFPADPKVIEIHEYLTERFSNLNQYTSENYSDGMYYGKTENERIFVYNTKHKIVSCYYSTLSKKLYEAFVGYDIKLILMYYITTNLTIKVEDILHVNLILTHIELIKHNT